MIIGTGCVSCNSNKALTETQADKIIDWRQHFFMHHCTREEGAWRVCLGWLCDTTTFYIHVTFIHSYTFSACKINQALWLVITFYLFKEQASYSWFVFPILSRVWIHQMKSVGLVGKIVVSSDTVMWFWCISGVVKCLCVTGVKEDWSSGHHWNSRT